MKNYTAVAERDESGTWVITVPELPGVVTQAKRLDRVQTLAADAIALWLNASPDTVAVHLETRLPQAATPIIENAITSRRTAEEAQRISADAVKKAATELVDGQHLSVRDAAVVLGMSYQRVQQILGPARERKDVKGARNAVRTIGAKRANSGPLADRPVSTKSGRG